MARYSTPLVSAAALAVNTAFAGLVGAAASNARLRRIILGTVAGTGAVSDMQLVVGINRATARGTATALTPGRIDPNSSAPTITGVDSAYTVQPTLAAQDLVMIPFNAKSGVDLPWEAMEELWAGNVATAPLVFVNRVNALPAGTSYVLTIEHEE